MLHGYTGDEDSMWVFASKLPTGSLLISPRGLFESSLGGYSWYHEDELDQPDLDAFQDGIQFIFNLSTWAIFSKGNFSNTKMVGFSQGAALAYCYALENPERLKALAGLSGFLPSGTERLIAEKPLNGLPIFIAHGLQDQMVPIERARFSVRQLEAAGGQVTYCENDAGHRLSAACFHALQDYFRKR